jgi:DNA/RNA-binding domain of Phe-tRNA-synthetase-like protein
MIPMQIGDSINTACPDFVVGQLECKVRNTPHNDDLWREIDEVVSKLCETTAIAEIRKLPEIAATREAYKQCGKDPNRYRPSAEALRRRIVKGQPLYRISTLVDIVNLLSLQSGCSIGAFDMDRIVGQLEWGIGKDGEPYEAIGRGALNIAGLPVLRDEAGPIGTPTSDQVRTRLSLESRSLLLNINAFAGPAILDSVFEDSVRLLAEFVQAREIRTSIVIRGSGR